MKTVERKYNMSNFDLAQLASDYVVFMTRDATEFDARVVNAALTGIGGLGFRFPGP